MMKIKNNKKGYTLIELLVYLSLLSLVVLCIFNIYIICQKLYVKSNKNILSQNQIINASLYIGDKVQNCSGDKVVIENNKINFNDYKESFTIYKEEDTLKIHFYKDKRDDFIIKENVADFNCEKKGDLIYFTINDTKGNFEKRCLKVKTNNKSIINTDG